LEDVNLSVSSTLTDGKVILTTNLTKEGLAGLQVIMNYDNTKLKFEKVDFVTKNNPMNYGTNKGNFINLGSLITNGDGVLDKTTEYRITFNQIGSLTDILGLTSISTTDAVNKDGKQLKVKLN
jgi:hypothetical protein